MADSVVAATSDPEFSSSLSDNIAQAAAQSGSSVNIGSIETSAPTVESQRIHFFSSPIGDSTLVRAKKLKNNFF